MNRQLLYRSESPCCHSPNLIVQSRPGGFVTQNCTICGIPRALSFNEIPDITCEKCGKNMEKFINNNKNYAYQCLGCGISIELASLVPYWAEYFDYIGFGLDSDQ